MKSSKAVADTGREADLTALRRHVAAAEGNAFVDGFNEGWQAATAAERWIPVEEKLPDNWKTVIICHENPIPYVHVARRVDDRWLQSSENIEIFTNRVTHWQPLPNPPAAIRGKAGQ